MNDRLAGLVPGPRSVRALEGTLALIHRPTVIAGADRPADASAHRAVSRVLASIPWPDRKPRPDPGPDSATPQVTVTTTSDLGDEAYRLTISRHGINVEAGGAPGAFYAAQTLRQLLPADAWRAPPPPPRTTPPQTPQDAAPGTCPAPRSRTPPPCPGAAPTSTSPATSSPSARLLGLDRRVRRAQAEPAAPAPHRRPGLAGREPALPRAARDRLAPPADPAQPTASTRPGLRRDPARRLLHAGRPGRDHRVRRRPDDHAWCPRSRCPATRSALLAALPELGAGRRRRAATRSARTGASSRT